MNGKIDAYGRLFIERIRGGEPKMQQMRCCNNKEHPCCDSCVAFGTVMGLLGGSIALENMVSGIGNDMIGSDQPESNRNTIHRTKLQLCYEAGRLVFDEFEDERLSK